MSGAITGFVTGGMTSNHCFVAGTVVITVAGKKAIEYIREGDLVLSEDPDTGDITYKKVLETYINDASDLIHLDIDGEEIVTTPAHPFYVKDTGFIKAGDLEEGAVLVDNEGNELHLLIKKWEHLQSPVPVYNFAVEDYHTYFVGSTKVLVHNECNQLRIETTKECSGVTNQHHIFPQQYKDKFEAVDIAIDQYTIDVGAGKGGLHMNGIHGKGGWNQLWDEFFENNPEATAKDMYQFAGKLMDDFCLNKYTIHPYRR